MVRTPSLWALIISAIAHVIFLAMANSAIAQTAALAKCLEQERSLGGITGTADFIGEPWNGSAFGVGLVPGTGLEFTFNNGTTHLYQDEENVIADNLWSLQNYWATEFPPPYPAVRRNDGSIRIITRPGDCSGWTVVHPTIIPDGWENHPLARCLTGAYRATDDIVLFEEDALIANFPGIGVSLVSNYPLLADPIIVERFDGYVAVSPNGNACIYQPLTIGGVP